MWLRDTGKFCSGSGDCCKLKAEQVRRGNRRRQRPMKALEFQAQLDSEGSLRVPKELAASIPKDQRVQVIVLFPETSGEEDWRRLTEQQFLSGYGDGDSVYDSL
jgi:hypothetical protein